MCVKKFVINVCVTVGAGVNLQAAVPVLAVKVRGDSDVLNACLAVNAVKVAVAGCSAESPEILVFGIASVTPAEHLECKVVGPRPDNIRDLKLRCVLAVLGISHKLSVYPKVDVGRDGSEMNDDPVSAPALRNVNCPSVSSHMIVLNRNERRVVLKMSPPGKSDVDIDRISVSVQFPDAGYRHLSPFGVIIIFCPESSRTLVCILNPVEFPFPLD